ncbi:MAG: hypothetical protein ACRYGR_08450 [Janthinobacterium lividum]
MIPYFVKNLDIFIDRNSSSTIHFLPDDFKKLLNDSLVYNQNIKQYFIIRNAPNCSCQENAEQVILLDWEFGWNFENGERQYCVEKISGNCFPQIFKKDPKNLTGWGNRFHYKKQSFLHETKPTSFYTPELRVNPVIIQRSRVDPVIIQPPFLRIKHEVLKMPEFKHIEPTWNQVSKLEP